MMEIMVSLSERHKCREKMISGCVFIIEGAFTQPMSQGIDGEGGLYSSYQRTQHIIVNGASRAHMMDHGHPKETGVEVPTAPVTPKTTGNGCRDNDAPNQRDRKVVSILPLNDRVLAQVADVSRAGLDSRFYEHPDDV